MRTITLDLIICIYLSILIGIAAGCGVSPNPNRAADACAIAKRRILGQPRLKLHRTPEPRSDVEPCSPFFMLSL
jgi:hypothetical protein